MFKQILSKKSIQKSISLFQFTYSHFLILQGSFLGVLLYRLIVLKIYPSPPFFYNNNDTFMDFFNVCVWTLNKDGTYPGWGSIYPPFAHLICHISYLFVNPKEGLIPNAQAILLRYNFIYMLPFFFMIFSYYGSVFCLVTVRCKTNFNWRNRLFLFISLSLSVPSLFLLERANLMFYAIAFCNVAFILSCQKNPIYNTYLRSILFSAAAAIKPYLLLLILLFKRVNYIVVFAADFVILNIIALLIWQPKLPEKIFSNLTVYQTAKIVIFAVDRCYYNFSINTYTLMMDIVRFFLSSFQQKLAIFGLQIVIVVCLLILFYNIYTFLKFYLQFHDQLSSTFLMFLTYTFCIYIINSILLEAQGYALNFFVPSIVLFISYFPKAKFNLFEFLIISYIFFYIPFLPERLYNEDFTRSYLSDLIGIPLKTLMPTFIIDPLFRPLFLQLFFTVFITKVYSQIKGFLRTVKN